MKTSPLSAVRNMTFRFGFEQVMLCYYLKGVTVEVLPVFLPLCRSLTAVFSLFDAFQYFTCL